jgi:hypothetical protein
MGFNELPTTLKEFSPEERGTIRDELDKINALVVTTLGIEHSSRRPRF